MSNYMSHIENPDSRFWVSQPIATQHTKMRLVHRLLALVLAAAFSATADQTWIGGVIRIMEQQRQLVRRHRARRD
jgi:hypothetical protein